MKPLYYRMNQDGHWVFYAMMTIWYKEWFNVKTNNSNMDKTLISWHHHQHGWKGHRFLVCRVARGGRSKNCSKQQALSKLHMSYTRRFTHMFRVSLLLCHQIITHAFF